MEYEEFLLLATHVQEIKGDGKKLTKFQVQVPRSPCGGHRR